MKFSRLVSILISVPVIIFLTVSLYSYHPEDSSWFFYSTHAHEIKNMCWKPGAYIAGLLLYLLGGVAYLIIPLSCLLLCYISSKRQLFSEWDRIASSLFFIIVLAGLSCVYSFDIAQSLAPGGVVGVTVYSMLVQLFYPFGALVFLHALLLALFIIIARFSFMGIISYSLEGIQYVGLKAYEHRIAHRMLYGIYVIARMVIARPIMLCITFIRQLVNGKALEYTGLISPESKNHAEELGTFYAMLQKKQEQEKPEKEYGWAIESQNQEQKEVAEYKQVGTMSVINDSIDTIPEKSMPIQMPVSQEKKYTLPNLNIFIGVDDEQNDEQLKKELEERAHILQEKLERFGISGKVVAIKRGPVVTLFEYQPHIDTKLSKIISLEDDLAMALRALSIRILAPIPGRSVVGFEVANRNRKDVLLSKTIQSTEYNQGSSLALPLILGEGTIGNTIMVDLARMPHLLIAGSTGSGKSVALNAMLMSLLCKLGPDELKLILIDPKRLEFVSYAHIAHLLFPIVTDPKRAAPVLRWVVKEMEKRYERMAQCGARNIFDHNEFAKQTGEEQLPFIVIVIDELSDLMLTAGRDVEDLITRVTQMARAAGIHMIVATQRPSVDVITGLIKVNFPSRISFRVTSRVDSRTILDCIGAEKLLGRGDMLFLDATNSQLNRVHGAYVSDHEIEQIVDHIRKQKAVEYLDISQELSNDTNNVSCADDELYQDILQFLEDVEDVSISLLQRKFRIGYNRSARIVDLLESQGLIMPPDGSKTRKVIR